MKDGHLEETLRRVLAEALSTEVRDPRLELVTISEVRLNRDRTVAEVFYTDMEEGGPHRTTHNALKKSRGFLQRLVGQRLRLRNVPQLRFRYDESLDRSFQVERLFDELKPKDEAKTEPESPDADEMAGGEET